MVYCKNENIPSICSTLASWELTSITLVEDITMHWDEYCLILLSIVYRGRAISLVWRVVKHRSSVEFAAYQAIS